MPRFRPKACPGCTRIIGMVGVWAWQEHAPGKFGMLVGTQPALGISVPKGIPMPDHRVPQWHPISALPMIAQALDGMVESAEDVLQSLEQARQRPHVLDDYTIGRVREAHGTQLNDLWWYTEQLARWQRANPAPAQQQELERLTQQVAALRR